MLHFFKPLLLVVLVALCVSPAYAQTQQTEANLAEPYSPYKWEIGTDLLWLINKNQLPAQSVFARYNYQTASGKSRGVRLRLGLDYMQLDSASVYGVNRHRDASIRPLIRLGYEFQQPAGRQVFFYGADLHFSYYHLNFKRGALFNQLEDIGRERIFEIGPVLFVGYKFFITPRLSIAAELSAQSIYRNRNFEAEVINVPQPRGTGAQRANYVEEFKLSILPLSVVNLSFHF